MRAKDALQAYAVRASDLTAASGSDVHRRSVALIGESPVARAQHINSPSPHVVNQSIRPLPVQVIQQPQFIDVHDMPRPPASKPAVVIGTYSGSVARKVTSRKVAPRNQATPPLASEHKVASLLSASTAAIDAVLARNAVRAAAPVQVVHSLARPALVEVPVVLSQLKVERGLPPSRLKMKSVA